VEKYSKTCLMRNIVTSCSLTYRGLRPILLFLLLASMPLLTSAKGFVANTSDGIAYNSPNNALSLKLGGRIHFDGTYFDEDKTTLHSGWLLRRMRLSLRINLIKDWRLSGQYDFVDEEERYNSLWIRYSGFKLMNLIAGQFEEPFGLEKSTSSNHITFMERALPNILGPGTNVGFGVSHWGKNWSSSGGLFWETYIEESDPFAAKEGMGLTGRFTKVPFHRRGWNLHLGVSGSYRLPDNRDRIRIRTRPESRTTDEKLISTGWLRDVESYTTGALEAALLIGPFSLQGEYTKMFVDRENGQDNESFDGNYIYVSWFVTGEHRPYSVKSGAFNRVKPVGTNGAWELALRRSHLNLNSGTGNIRGGKQTNMTWGLNWYFHQSARLMLNYIQVDTDNYAGDDDPTIIQLRLQLAI